MFFFFFFKQKTAYEMLRSLVGSEMCIRDRFDGTFGHVLNNQGEQWGLLDFSSHNFDQGDNTVETAKPTGYSWRVGPPESSGIGGFYDVLGPTNYSVEKGTFTKIREASITYHVGALKGPVSYTHLRAHETPEH